MSARAVGATTLTQQSENFGYSAVRLRRIVKIQFGIVNPTDLVRIYGYVLPCVVYTLGQDLECFSFLKLFLFLSFV